jgi:glycosyltransferase involved in cell wall biosynthesis
VAREGREKISIVLATCNGAPFLRGQLDSLLSQTFPFDELLIGDDDSRDGTWDILKEYARNDGRIRLIRHAPARGFLKNFETLLTEASGDYVALCDQDDLWMPQKLERQMEAMRRAEAEGKRGVLVHTDLSLIDEADRPIAPSYFVRRGYRFPEKRSVGLLLGQGGVMGNTVLTDRTLLERALPFPPGLRYHDWWLGVVAELFGTRITLQESLVAYRIHTANVSAKSRWLSGEMRYPWRHRWLPRRDEGRYRPLRALLGEVSGEDRETLVRYLAYLRARRGWIWHYPGLVRQGLLDGPLHDRLRWGTRIAVATFLGAGTQ